MCREIKRPSRTREGFLYVADVEILELYNNIIICNNDTINKSWARRQVWSVSCLIHSNADQNARQRLYIVRHYTDFQTRVR